MVSELFVLSYVVKGIMEAGPVITPQDTEKGTADKFEREKDIRQLKRGRQARNQKSERPMLQLFPASEETGPTPFLTEMF